MSDPVMLMAVIKGITAWATPSMSLRFAAARLTQPKAPLTYLLRPHVSPAKANGSPRQRRHPSR
jgi:hypothetical protein